MVSPSLNILFSPLSSLIPCPAHLEAKKRNERFKITWRFAERTPASLLCAFRLVLYSLWICLGGFVGRLRQFACLGGASEPSALPLPKKLEISGKTLSFLVANIFSVSALWDFQSRLWCLLGVRWAKEGD